MAYDGMFNAPYKLTALNLYQCQIFEPFYTTKKEGTGLGLYITNLIVLAHRGKIRCESEVGKGTKFIIEVPVYAGKMTRGIWRKPR